MAMFVPTRLCCGKACKNEYFTSLKVWALSCGDKMTREAKRVIREEGYLGLPFVAGDILEDLVMGQGPRKFLR